ncbi:hypothetical protein Q4485_12480 [Granulosicoccaceae sp. 1_MG-2023]|nr:hypothetical protein [Granulosicoccaceae sp. 1_MG-2023]
MLYKLELGKTVLLQALAYGHAFAMMMLILALPIAMLYSKYSIEFLMSATLLFFTVSFVPVIWTLVGWLDGYLSAAFFQSGVVWDLLTKDPVTLIKRATLAITTISLYVFAPVFFGWMIALANHHVSSAIGGMQRAHLGADAAKAGNATVGVVRTTAGIATKALTGGKGGKGGKK